MKTVDMVVHGETTTATTLVEVEVTPMVEAVEVVEAMEAVTAVEAVDTKEEVAEEATTLMAVAEEAVVEEVDMVADPANTIRWTVVINNNSHMEAIKEV